MNPFPDSSADNDVTSKSRVSPALAAAIASSTFVVPYALSASTSPAPNHPRAFLWYRSLRKPGFKPPDVAIPIAWTGIEAALAYGGYRLMRKPSSPARNQALAWLAANVIAIGAWSRLFFGGRNLPASTVAAAAMVGTGAAYVAQAKKVDRPAALAGAPFVAWVAFATVLTAAIWRRNR